MTGDRTDSLARYLDLSAAREALANRPDGTLLSRFIDHRDEDAFAALVRRHGPMVLGVCRRRLRRHDAEDAFQATFLILARKAGSIAPREMVANWLYGVAHRVTLKVVARGAARRSREYPIGEVPEPASAERDPWDDLRLVLDEELARLPDRYRAPILLCDIAGMTRREAAAQLGWVEGTLSWRLGTARQILAQRLTRRGVVFTGGISGVVAVLGSAAAPVSASLASAATVGAGRSETGRAAVSGCTSGRVVTLTEGVVNAMWFSKLKALAAMTMATVVLATGAVSATVGIIAERTPRAGASGGEPGGISVPAVDPKGVPTRGADEKPLPVDQLATIKQEFADAEAAFRKAAAPLAEAKEEQPRYDELVKKLLETRETYYARALKLAKDDPTSDTGFAALEWLLTYPAVYSGPSGVSAIELMAKHHAANPRVGKTAAILGHFGPSEPPKAWWAAVAFLRAVVAKNPDRTARGQAALGIAWQAAGRFYEAELAGAGTADRLAMEAEAELEAVVREYGDCRTLRTLGSGVGAATIADETRAFLNELRTLRIGMGAPKIDGKDLDGGRLKLSEYRGKVVVLVFWASTCGPCMADIPHEREIVETYKGRPLVLVGVNGDDRPEDAKKAVERAQITWRSFGDGGAGPIATTWAVEVWPRVFVIDHEGIIREKHRRGKDLDVPLEKLVAEAEKAAGRK